MSQAADTSFVSRDADTSCVGPAVDKSYVGPAVDKSSVSQMWTSALWVHTADQCSVGLRCRQVLYGPMLQTSALWA